MAKILSFGGKSGSEKNTGKGNPLKSVWTSFQSLDRYGKFFILTALLVIIATPFIAANLLETRQRAEAPAELPPQAQAKKPPSVPDELLIKFKAGVADEHKNATLKRYNLTEKDEIPQIGVKLIKVNPKSKDKLIVALSKNPAVDFVEENRIVSIQFSPDDPWYAQGFQWNLTKIQAPQAWDITQGSTSFPVAILDTGIDSSHPDLQGRVVSKINFTDSTSAEDVNGHGTHVGGIAGAATNNSVGIAGLGFNTPLINVKVMGDNGTGGTFGIAQGIIWATDHGAKVINLSVGAPFGSYPEEIAVNYAWGKGVVIAAAAGNCGSNDCGMGNGIINPVFYPAAYPNAIAVASTDLSDTRSGYSEHGDWVDVAAPGGNVYSTVPYSVLSGRGYASLAGTSQSAPHVAGLAALVFTQVTDKNGDGFTNDEVRRCIEQNADNIGITGIGSGRINAAKAVSCVPSAVSDTTAPTVSVTSPTSGGTVSGDITVTASASDNVGVTKVDLYRDNILVGSDESNPYSFFLSTRRLTDGAHTLTTKAYDRTGNFGTSGTVSVTVSNGAGDVFPPSSAAVSSPRDGSTVTGVVNFVGYGQDGVGIVAMDFFVDDAFIGEVSNGPDLSTYFTLAETDWDTTSYSNGAHTLYIKAVDAAGHVITSPIITVTVNNTNISPTPTPVPSTPSPLPTAIPTPTRAPTPTPTRIPTPTPVPGDTTAPSVSVTSPLNGAILKRNLAITIAASATDNTGISKVEFYVNGALTCTDTSSPYACNWKVPGKPNANYTISAKAYDLSTNSAINAVNVKTGK